MLYVNIPQKIELFNFFVPALSSIKTNIDNSNCILVQDVKAVTHSHGIRDALSTSSPSDGTSFVQNVLKLTHTHTAIHTFFNYGVKY